MEAYVRNQITIAKTQAISIDFTAGRGPNGLSATLDIRPASTSIGSVSRGQVFPAFNTKAQEAEPDPKPEQETVSADEAEEQDSPETDGETEAADEAEDTSKEEAPAPRTSIFAKKAAS